MPGPIYYPSGGAASGAGGGATITSDTLATIEALTPGAGDMGYPTDSIYVLICRVAGTWSYTIPGVYGDLAKPPTSGWTAYNSGSVAVAGGVRWLTLPNEAFGGNGWRGETRAEPSDPSVTPYYAEWVIVGADKPLSGAGFSDGTHFQFANARQSGRDMEIIRYTSATTGGTATVTRVMDIGSVWRGRIEHDGTNRVFFLHSPDGTYQQIATEADGTAFTSDSFGWWGTMLTAGVSCKIGLVHYETGAL